MSAFARAQAAQGSPVRVFDWVKAARLIRERKPNFARAGLRADWEYTGGPIYANGAPVPQDETYTYLASLWAIPELDLDGDIVECWVWAEGSGWDASTYWPDAALTELRGAA